MRRSLTSVALFCVCLLPLVCRVDAADPPCGYITGGLCDTAVPKDWYEKHGAKSGDSTDPSITACNQITLPPETVQPATKGVWDTRCKQYTIYEQKLVYNKAVKDSKSTTGPKEATNADGSPATVVCKNLFLCDTEEVKMGPITIGFKCKTQTGYPKDFRVQTLTSVSPCTK